MSYSIIGSGAIGSALAGHFVSKGIEVFLANSRGPASLKDVVGKLGSKVQAATAKEAANANIVILAVPFPSVADAVGGISDWRGRIVVDATNAVDVPSLTPTDLGGRLSSEIVAEAVPGARLVKAFNTLFAAVLAGNPLQGGGRRVIFISSDDVDARCRRCRSVRATGLLPNQSRPDIGRWPSATLWRSLVGTESGQDRLTRRRASGLGSGALQRGAQPGYEVQGEPQGGYRHV